MSYHFFDHDDDWSVDSDLLTPDQEKAIYCAGWVFIGGMLVLAVIIWFTW